MSDHEPPHAFRPGYTAEWAFAFHDGVMERVRATVPELAARWPFQGIEYDAHSDGVQMLLVIRSNRLPVTTAGPVTPTPVPERLLPLPTTDAEFVKWEAEARSHGLLGASDLVALVPILHSVDEASLARPDAQWEEFSERQQAMWGAAVGAGYWRGFQTLLATAPNDVDNRAGEQEPINSEVFQVHADLKLPAKLDQPIWRYMSATKFLALLSDSAVYFARADLLGDDWEGALGAANAAIDRSHGAPLSPGNGPPERDSSSLYISCWHAQDGESAAMWSLYARWDPIAREGVAVRTTFRRFLESLGGDESVFAGQVVYHDYEREFVPENNWFAPYVRKRKSFEHEREIRAMIPRWAPPFPAGIAVPVDLDAMIQEVRVAPQAPDWIRDLIESVSRTYGLDVAVNQSAMDAPPLR